MIEYEWPYPPLWQQRREECVRCGCSHCDRLRADVAGRARALARYVAAMNTGTAPGAGGA